MAKWRITNRQEATVETAVIAEVLGGRKVLGKSIKKPDDLAQLVRKGLPVEWNWNTGSQSMETQG